MKIKDLSLVNKIIFTLTVITFLLALSSLLILSTLEYSKNINKQVMNLKQEIKTKEESLQKFGTTIAKATYLSKLDGLTCKERITMKFDIIKAFNNIKSELKSSSSKDLLNFEDEIFKGINSCAKDFYNEKTLEKISKQIFSELSDDINKHIKKLRSLQLSLFYTNEI